MHPNKVNRNQLKKLTDLPNIGQAMAEKLSFLGINQSTQLIGKCPYQLYEELCQKSGMTYDPCVLDVFISITRFMGGEEPQPWWAFTQERKTYMRHLEVTK